MGYNERLAALEKRVAELEVQVQAQPKNLDADAILNLLEKQVRETLAADRQLLER